MNPRYLALFAFLVLVAVFLSYRGTTAIIDDSQGEINPKPEFVASERDFIQGMVPHHQEAITSARELLTVAVDPDVRTLASNIIRAQEAEITEMKTWHAQWYDAEYRDDGKYKPMMRPFLNLSPKDAEARFVADMIGHHEHAVFMARELATFAERPELRTLAANIIRDQEAEIKTLTSWLQSKYGQTPKAIDHSMH
jgi:uncharacterized protein (DUF305 family)